MKDGGYDFKSLAARHQEMAEYLAERTMDQRCTFKPVANALGEYVGQLFFKYWIDTVY